MAQKLVERMGLERDEEFNTGSQSVSGDSGLNIVIQNVQAAISAREQRNSQIVTVTALSRNPEKAVRMANTLTQIYVDEQVEAKFEAAQKTVTWLSERVGVLQHSLTLQEGAIAELKARMDLSPAGELSILNARLQEARTRLTDVSRRMRENANNTREFLSLRASNEVEKIASLNGDAALLALLADNSAGSSIVTRLDRIEADLKLQQYRLEQQVQVLTQSVTEFELAVQQQATDRGELQQLEREAQATRVLYETLLSRLREASTLSGLQQAEARVLSPAVIGTDQSYSPIAILLFAGMIGAIFSGGYVLFRQFVHAGFRTADELEAATGNPVFGQLPTFPVKKRSELLSYLSDHPTSAASEAVRNLRTSVLLSNAGKPPQVILSASSVPGEGKTTHAIALVQNLAAMGKRVLMIEGDMRRRTLSSYFPAEQTLNLVSVLTQEASLTSAVQNIQALGADVLLGETSSASAADMFASKRFGDLIIEARSLYDVIVIDSPPVLIVPDARVISHHVDSIVFSVAWDKTTKQQVEAGLKQFELLNGPVIGMILSQIKPKQMARYGGEGTNPGYSGFGSPYYDTA